MSAVIFISSYSHLINDRMTHMTKGHMTYHVTLWRGPSVISHWVIFNKMRLFTSDGFVYAIIFT